MAFWRRKTDKEQRAGLRGNRGVRGDAKDRPRQTKSLGGMVDLLESTLAEGSRKQSKATRKR